MIMRRTRNGPETERRERSTSGDAMMPYTGSSGVMTQIRDEFDRMFDRFLRSFPAMGWMRGTEQPLAWGLDLKETDNAITVRADLPGFDADDIDLQVAGDRLTIRATHKTETDEKDRG